VLRQKKNNKNQGASSAARVQGGTSFSRDQQRTKRKEKNVLPQNKNKEALDSDNEESNNEE